MGYALAEEFADAGAEVILVSGPVSVSAKNPLIKVVSVNSASEMYEACHRFFPEAGITVLSAAVADFAPEEKFSNKVKRGKENWEIRLKPTRDIAASLGEIKRDDQVLVGFALETDNELNNAIGKLKRKNLDLIVLNSLKDKGAGFGTDTNKVSLIDKNNNIDNFELKSKTEVAKDIVEKIIRIKNHD
jgi:phosphopantothenoylcysteine decarboxylase/phosphopantothenate--cysteine ligase